MNGRVRNDVSPAYATLAGPVERVIELDDQLISAGLSDLEAAHGCLIEIASKESRETGKEFKIILKTTRKSIPVVFDNIFTGKDGKIIIDATREIANKTSGMSTTRLEANAPHLIGFNWKQYLTMNSIRVLNLVRLLRKKGIDHGSILEIGGYFGSFALPLKRIGYDVSVVDRYEDYAEDLRPFVDMMEFGGINVIKANRKNESETLVGLGDHDCVIAMAVIEHLPHTPRPFLELMKKMVKPGGIIALDTPNIASYWNRKNLNVGQTIFQDIRHQFYTEVPFEGHHREYTANEIKWMMEEIGLVDIETHYFDYNMFQFPNLEGEHIDCFLQMLQDPSCAGLIIATGHKTLK